MPGPNFAALALDATAAIDAVMAEPFDFNPMARPDVNKPGFADSSRLATTVIATYLDRVAPKETVQQAYNSPQRRPPGVESGTPRIWISSAELANQGIALGGPFVVKAGDMFVRQADCVTWLVNSVEPTAGGALRCSVNMVGR